MNRFAQTICWVLLALLLGNVALAADFTKDTPEQVKKNVAEKKAVLIDVRAQDEWDAGHLEGAIFLSITELRKGIAAEKLAEKLPKDKILYTYCVVGQRARGAGDILGKLGYEVRCLKPGYKSLVEAGLEKAK